MTLPQDSPAGTKKKLTPGCLVWAGLAVLLLAGLVFLLRRPLLTAVADGLIVNDQPHPADILFVLNGDFNTRPERAAELYSQGLVSRVVIARAEDSTAVKLGLIPNETDISVGVMKRLGVPAEKITILATAGGVTSTFDEARALHDYVEKSQISRVIVVTSEFHSRRAKWIFTRELAGLPLALDMIAVPYATFNRTDWWTNENGLITLNNEYIKLIFYYFKYR
jgi:uncharacterized SAM-binding protein YcdF (DUF218 family)